MNASPVNNFKQMSICKTPSSKVHSFNMKLENVEKINTEIDIEEIVE